MSKSNPKPSLAPDPEVDAKPKRRRFSGAYKQRILEECDAATEPGAIGEILRREGLYSSHLSEWRKTRRLEGVAGLAAKKRGRKPKSELAKEIERLRGTAQLIRYADDCAPRRRGKEAKMAA
jgi:transposase-like protein